METPPGDRDNGARRYLPLCAFCQQVWSLPTFSFCHSHLLINGPRGHELRKRSCRSCVDAGHPKATGFFSHALCPFYVSLFPAKRQDLSTHIVCFSGHSYFVLFGNTRLRGNTVTVRATSVELLSFIKVGPVSQSAHF